MKRNTPLIIALTLAAVISPLRFWGQNLDYNTFIITATRTKYSKREQYTHHQNHLFHIHTLFKLDVSCIAEFNPFSGLPLSI